MIVGVKESYTSADALPVKLMQNIDVISSARRGIIPYHVQLIPTNKCNMSCRFCSCSNEDRTLEMPWKVMSSLIDDLHKLGTKAVTITGGGEPLLYPYFDRMVGKFKDAGIEMGLVTNGLMLPHQQRATLSKIVWCRISNGDHRKLDGDYMHGLEKIVQECPSVDWAFSHVVSDKPNLEEIKRIVAFSNNNGFTHVRLVADLLCPESVPMDSVRAQLESSGIDISKVIFQHRDMPEKGSDCYIGYLKPLISASGKVFMCCGVQYAIKGKERAMPDELCMGTVNNLREALGNMDHVAKGHQCDRCYYGNYNRVLKLLSTEIRHERFL